MSTASTRSWFEGTLDVISGMAPRSSTPVNVPPSGAGPAQRYGSSSVPSSPARGNKHTVTSQPSYDDNTMEILRLPSQDSVDISIHNDSGHGKSTPAQMIKELRQSNARLTARTAALEADFMNQLNETTRQFEERHGKLQDELRSKTSALTKAEARIKTDKTKLKEQGEALQRLKEESAFHRHTISDLKTQLREAQEQQAPENPQDTDAAAPPEEWMREREEMFAHMERLEHENQHLKSTGGGVAKGNQEGSDPQQQLLETQQTLYETERLLAELTTKAIQSQSKHDEIVHHLEAELHHMQQDLEAEIAKNAEGGESNASSSEHVPSKSNEADVTAIRDLQNKLSQAEEKLETKIKEAAAQELWRKEEADDLRMLNDAQDEEIASLRVKLKDAVNELDVVKHELEEAKDKGKTGGEAEAQLEEARRSIEELKEEWQASATLHDAQRADLENQVDELSADKQSLEEQVEQLRQEAVENVANNKKVSDELLQMQLDEFARAKEAEQEALMNQMDELQHEYDKAQEFLLEANSRIASADASKAQLMQEHQQDIEALQQKLDTASQRIEELEQNCMSNEDKYKSENEELKQRIDNLTSAQKKGAFHELEIAKLREQVQKLEKQKTRAEEEQDARRQRLQETMTQERKRSEDRLEEEINQLQQQLQDVKDQKEQGEEKLKEDIAELQFQNEALTQEKEQGEHQFEVEIAELHQQVQDLDEQIAELRKQQAIAEKQKKNRSLDDDGSISELRQKLSQLAKSEASLKEKLKKIQNEADHELAEVKEKLQDRDTTISALVKSSVTMEQQIAEQQMELELLRAQQSSSNSKAVANEQGVDVILSKGDDLSKLKSSLDAYKDTETRLSNEVFRLKRQLHHAKLENGRLRQKMIDNNNASLSTSASQDDENSVTSSTIGPQLKERDDAIARLVKQTMSQDETITSLKRQLKQASAGGRSKKDEEVMKQLRQETEMFAGQVIEQDEEIESLKKKLADSEEHVGEVEQEVETFKKAAEEAKASVQQAEDRLVQLEQQLATGQFTAVDSSDGNGAVDMNRIYSLEAEVDELREANSEQLAELRMLRRTAHDTSAAAGALSDAQSKAAAAEDKIAGLEQQIEELKQQLIDNSAPPEDTGDKERILDLEQELVERDRIIGDLKKEQAAEPQKPTSDPALYDEMELEGLRSELDTLKHNLTSQTSTLELQKETIRELERMAAEQTEEQHAHFEAEKEELMGEVETLTQQLDEAQATIDELRKDEDVIAEFKSKLEQADEDREVSERTIIDNYERKLSLLTLDKDVLLDKLRKDLSTEKETNAKTIEESEQKIAALEKQRNDLQQHAQAEIDEREKQMLTMEHTLEASKQLIENMRREMDHLQGSMVNATVGRREEIEDMQQELVSLTATTAQQEREVTALRQELQDKDVEHQSQVAKLQETIELLESQQVTTDAAAHRDAQDLAMELKVQQVKDRLEKLKWRNTTLQEENATLRERLATNSTGGDGVELQAAQQKIASLQLKVAEQSKRIQGLEGKLEKARRDAAAAPALPVPAAPAPTTIHSSKRQSGKGFFGRRKSDPVSQS